MIDSHLTTKSKQCHHHLREVFALPQVDGLKNVNVGDSVCFDGFLETGNAITYNYYKLL